MIRETVSSEESGITLLAFLKHRLGDSYSNRQIKRSIENNHCLVNGRAERHASTVVGTGDVISFKLEEDRELKKPLSKPMHRRLEKERILYEDSRLIIYNKPAGLACDAEGLGALAVQYCPAACLVHRLDRDTTGVIVIAKDADTLEIMFTLFRNRAIQKSYLAIVDGALKSKQGEIDNYLGKIHSYKGQGIWGIVDKSKGLHAHTSWVVLQSVEAASLLRCVPITGRTHQLRVHLSSIGHPILGDYQYCQKFRSSYRPQRYLLHAAEIRFTFPGGPQEIVVSAPPPEDFVEALNHFGMST